MARLREAPEKVENLRNNQIPALRLEPRQQYRMFSRVQLDLLFCCLDPLREGEICGDLLRGYSLR